MEGKGVKCEVVGDKDNVVYREEEVQVVGDREVVEGNDNMMFIKNEVQFILKLKRKIYNCWHTRGY